MTHRSSQLMFTPAVRAVQQAEGSAQAYARLNAPWADPRKTLAEADLALLNSASPG